MTSFKFSSDVLQLTGYDNKIFKVGFNVLDFKGKKCYFIEALDKVNPTDYTEQIYGRFKKYMNNSYIFLDVSNIYGLNNNSWLVMWKFFVEENMSSVKDEKFYRMKDLNNVAKDEYIMLKEYIRMKNNIIAVYA